MEYKQEQINKLTRVISDAMDAAMIEAGMANTTNIRPYDELHSDEKRVIQQTAKTVYERLHWDAAVGYVVVI